MSVRAVALDEGRLGEAVIAGWGRDTVCAGDVSVLAERRKGSPAFLLCGRTRRPEHAVVVPWTAIDARADVADALLTLTDRDAVAMTSHAWSGPEVVSPALSALRKRVPFAARAAGDTWDKTAERVKATVLVVVPGASNVLDGPHIPGLRAIVFCGASPVTDRERRVAQEWSGGADVVSLFELRETGPIAVSRGPVPWGCVGTPLEGVVVDAAGARLRVRTPWGATEGVGGGAVADQAGFFTLSVGGHMDKLGRLHLEMKRRVNSIPPLVEIVAP